MSAKPTLDSARKTSNEPVFGRPKRMAPEMVGSPTQRG